MAVSVFSSLKIFFKRKIIRREGLVCARSLSGTVDLESETPPHQLGDADTVTKHCLCWYDSVTTLICGSPEPLPQ